MAFAKLLRILWKSSAERLKIPLSGSFRKPCMLFSAKLIWKQALDVWRIFTGNTANRLYMKNSCRFMTVSYTHLVTEIRMGNSVLVVSGFFKEDTTATATDKMMKVLEAETAAGHKPPFSA